MKWTVILLVSTTLPIVAQWLNHPTRWRSPDPRWQARLDGSRAAQQQRQAGFLGSVDHGESGSVRPGERPRFARLRRRAADRAGGHRYWAQSPWRPTVPTLGSCPGETTDAERGQR